MITPHPDHPRPALPAHRPRLRQRAWPPLRYGLALLLLVTSALGLPPAPPPGAAAAAEPLTLQWSATESANTTALAWGDYDGDGDLDLAVANAQQPAALYRNDDGQLGAAVWTTGEILPAQSVAWGDYDGDGDLDLALGVYDLPSRLYRNESGTLTRDTRWAPAVDYTQFIAWGDVDGDGDLDLAVGNGCRKFDTTTCSRNLLYRNSGDGLESTPTWTAAGVENTLGMAWGDVDGDGALDLAIATVSGAVRLYAGDGDTLGQSPAWSVQVGGPAISVAWGDVDGDGDLDLAVSTVRATNQVYRNNAGALGDAPFWRSGDSVETRSLAWGDYDSDGDLDLAAGNGGEQNEPSALYRNDGGTLTAQPVWRSTLADRTSMVTWGDYDGDGDLDLASGNLQGPSRLYRNEVSTLHPEPYWSDQNEGRVYGLAWGDVDGDDDLDLVASSVFGPNVLYRNEAGSLVRAWESTDQNFARGLALGDADGDGDLDLAIAEAAYGSSKIYRNNGGTFATAPFWSAPDTDRASSVTWGDYDGDGDLDLAVGTFSTLALPEEGQVNRLYRNDGGGRLSEAWTSAESEMTFAVAWGDVDNDGDLDLAVGNSCPTFATTCVPNRLYRNDRGALTAAAVWSSAERDRTASLAWGDYDGDGDLDLAAGNTDQPSRLYRNEGGALSAAAVWSSIESAPVAQVAWADYDSDGDLDLTAGSFGQPSRIYRNDRGSLTASAAWRSSLNDTVTSLAWGDVDSDGDLDLATGSREHPVRAFRNTRDQRASPAGVPVARLRHPAPPDPGSGVPAPILSAGTVAISYTLAHPQGAPAARVVGFYSLDGGGRWLPARPTPATPTTNLAASPAGTPHVYTWDVFGSGVMGQSDAVVFRLVVWPTLTAPPGAPPGPFHYGSFATQTSPFRVRGTQVRVLREDGSPGQAATGALVYRLSSGAGGGALGSTDGAPFRTDGQGYLQGRANLAIGDQLVALLPISTTERATLYATSAAPTPRGLDASPVAAQGLQTLRVSAERPLLVFPLDVSLEWDARADQTYLGQLARDLRRTSELLYDWSNGQVALGEVRVFLNRERWDEADVRILASNRVRPTANQGGVVERETTDPAAVDRPIVYAPGHVTVGAVWTRYGDPSGVLGEDWPRALAHELGHYLLFLDDNYLGLNEQGLLVPVDGCPGAMSDPYRLDTSEFYPPRGWGSTDGHPSCLQTLSHQTTGRADWSTIRTFYPELRAPTELFGAQNPGPAAQPLALTEVRIVPPAASAPALEVPTFAIVSAADGGRVQPGPAARAALFQPGRRQLIDLGQPILDRVDARGARIGDRVCIYDLGESTLGCATVAQEDQQIPVHRLAPSAWQPQITFTPVTSRTLDVRVANVPAGLELWAVVYPEVGVAAGPVRLAAAPGGYGGQATLGRPAYAGHIHLWVDEAEPRREALVAYSVGGNPGHVRSRKAPVVSPDGLVVLYGDDLAVGQGAAYALQTAPALPGIPAWASLVGQGVRLVTAGTVDFARASISFNYLGGDVPPGGEEWLRIYYWDGATWVPLETVRDSYHNIAAASIADTGPGLYALMSSVEIPLSQVGWNLVSYPLREARPVAEALASIDGAYSLVYGYTPGASSSWRVYAPDAPRWLLDDPRVGLGQLVFGEGYWIYMRRPAPWFPGRVERSARQAAAGGLGELANLPSPPATFYGRLTAGPGFVPRAGMAVQALADGRPCGTGSARATEGGIVYIVHALAEWQGADPGCGRAGRTITFTAGGVPMGQSAAWSNAELTELDLSPGQTRGSAIYLPILDQRGTR